MSFEAGFGQSAVSVMVAVGVLAAAAAFIYLQVAGVAHGGRYPAGVFSGYGAGIGILLAQAIIAGVWSATPTCGRGSRPTERAVAQTSPRPRQDRWNSCRVRRRARRALSEL